MAAREHEELLRKGAGGVRQWRDLYPDQKLDLRNASFTNRNLNDIDLSEAQLQGCVFNQAQMQGANFSGANLTSAKFNSADLTAADFTGADLTAAELTQANLTRATLDRAILNRANLSRATLPPDRLRNARLAGAQFIECSLEGVDLGGCDLSKANFSGANLRHANLSGANLEEASLAAAKLDGATLTGANLRQVAANHAVFEDTDLTGADLHNASLELSRFRRANIASADFFEARIEKAEFINVRGAPGAKHLETTRNSESSMYFETAQRGWVDRFCDWETIRIFGRMPLFTASYTALISIPIVMYGYALYNERTETLRQWAATTGSSSTREPLGNIAVFVTENVHKLNLPTWSLELLVSTILLAAASTIYAAICPSRVKEFSRDQWCDEFNKSIVHYWAYAWKHRHLRVLTFALYVVGALGVVVVLTVKLVNTAIFIYQNSGWTLF